MDMVLGKIRARKLCKLFFTRRIENLPTHAPMHVGITPELSLTDMDISPLRSIKCSFIDHSGSRITVERSADATEQYTC